MRIGKQSWKFIQKPVITATATVVGPEEGKGPLGNEFDVVHKDMNIGQDTWEKAERALMEEAAKLALDKAGIAPENVDFYIGGDLMNQIISSNFAARTLAIPYIGLFAACSVSMASLALSAYIVDTGGATTVLSGTCSHNSSAEKQFRYPTEYGAQKPPSAQYTVTGAGACIVQAAGNGPVVESATIGRIVDMGLTDPFNMGAAMAPAAVDTIQAHLRDLNRTPADYDLIVTGDLAEVGSKIAADLFIKNKMGMDVTQYNDCGLMVYDLQKQPVQAGGSGAACSAVVTYSHLLRKLNQGEYNRILVVATGSLLSSLSVQQGDSIPCIAHAVSIERSGEF